MDQVITRPDGPIEVIGRPNQTVWADEVGIPPFRVRTNTQGIREEPLSPYSPPNTTRVLVVGDSFTFGTGVNESERFTEISDNLLGSEYQIVNAGFPGWGAQDYYIFLRERGMAYHPDIVVIAFLFNDIFSANRSRSIHQRAERMLHKQENVSRLTESERWKRMRDRIGSMKKPIREQVLANKTFFMRSSFVTAVSRTVDLARDRNTCIMFYPMSSIGYLGAWAEQQNVPISYPPQRYSRLRSQGKLQISELDAHPSARGHRILGRGLAAFIADNSQKCTAQS